MGRGRADAAAVVRVSIALAHGPNTVHVNITRAARGGGRGEVGSRDRSRCHLCVWRLA